MKRYRPDVALTGASTSNYDCLNTAENIMHGEHRAPGQIRSRFRDDPANRDCGESDALNQTVAQKLKDDHPDRVDGNASPGVGDSFLMVYVGPPRDDISPYHAATVVYETAGKLVTLETFAGQRGDFRYREYDKPGGGPYALGVDPPTFHNHWTTQDPYYSSHGVDPNHLITVVISKRS